jgi:hypothetical protein
MSDTNNPAATLDTACREGRREQLERAWHSWQSGQEPPTWQQFLPASGEPCSPQLIASLVSLDIEFRVKASLPGLLAERYFDYPRLQEEDARLDATQQVEIIHGELQQRWKHGLETRRGDYETAFPQHAEAEKLLRECLKVRQAKQAHA